MSRILLYEEEVIDALRSKIAEFTPYMNGALEKLPLECEIAIRKLRPAHVNECITDSTLDISLYKVNFSTNDIDEYRRVQQFCYSVIDGDQKTLYLDDILDALNNELESYPDYAREAVGVAHAMHVIEKLAEVKHG